MDKTVKICLFSLFFIFYNINLYAEEPLEISNWDIADIKNSRTVFNNNINDYHGKKNLYVYHSIAKQQLSFLDPVTFKPLTSLIVKEIAGVPIYEPDGRYVYISTKDGWIMIIAV